MRAKDIRAAEAATAIESTVRNENIDWQIANKYVDDVKVAGFDGMRMRERDAGAPVFDDDDNIPF